MVNSQFKNVSTIKVFINISELDRNIINKELNCEIYDERGIGKTSDIKVKVSIEVAKEVPIEPIIVGQPYDKFQIGNNIVVPDKVLIKMIIKN